MDRRQLSELYFKNLWDFAKNHTLDLFFTSKKNEMSENDSLFIKMVCSIPLEKEKRVVDEIKVYRENEKEYKLNTWKGFQSHVIENQKKENFVIGRGVKIKDFHSSWAKYDPRKILEDFHEIVLLNIFKQAKNDEEKLFIVSHIDDLLTDSYIDHIEAKIDFMLLLKKNKQEKIAKQIWNNVKEEDYHHSFTITYIEKLRSFFDIDECHKEIRPFVCKIATQKNNEYYPLHEIQKYLINLYKNNIEQLKDYAHDFKLIDNYIKTQENEDDLFIKETEETLLIKVDINKLIASVSTNLEMETCKKNFTLFMSNYKKEDKRIKDIVIKNFSPTKEKFHFVLYVSTRQIENMPILNVFDIQEKVIELRNMMRDYNQDKVLTKEYIVRWHRKEALTKHLNQKALPVNKHIKSKI